MRIFVAGATGVLGAPLVRRLVSQGHSVVGLTRSAGKADFIRALGAEPAVADALDRAALGRAVRQAAPEAVFHLLTALPKAGPLKYRDLDATNAVRTEGTHNLLEAAAAAGAKRLIAESMIFVYGYGDHGEDPVTEEDLPATGGLATGLAKSVEAMRTMERLVRIGSFTSGVQGVVLRFGLLYGLEASNGYEVALRARQLPMFGGGLGVAPWVHTADAVTALVAALEHGRAGEAYNVVDDEPVTHREFFHAMAGQLGAPAPGTMPLWVARLVAPVAAAFFEVRLRASNAKARRELEWRPASPTYREGMLRLCDPVQAPWSEGCARLA